MQSSPRHAPPPTRATLVSIFCDRVADSRDEPALLIKTDGAFRPATWGELNDSVLKTAAALQRLGVAAGDRVVQVADNRREWIELDLALHLLGAVHVAVHTSLSGPQIAFQIVDTDAKLVVLSGSAAVDKLAAVENASVIAWPAGVKFLSHDPLEPSGSKAIAGEPVEWFRSRVENEPMNPLLATEAAQRVGPDDLATILYTSGVTGEPKGVMLTQHNLASNAVATVDAFDLVAADVRLCWLPLSHIFARTADLYAWIARGSLMALAESREQILANCNEVHPTVMNGVPYFFEKVMRHLLDSGTADEPGKLATLLGGRLRMCCSGGAPLPDHVATFFNKRGVPLVQGYGLTESSPVITVSTLRHQKLGTVGRAIRDAEVRLADDGEVLTRGPHVMTGYWRRPDLTAQAIHDGWLHTGDLGQLDNEGYLRIIGRKKELLVTASGKNVSPSQIEALLTANPLIVQAVVLGDGCKFLSALIVPNPDRLRAWIIAAGIAVSSREEALAHPRVNAMYREQIDACLAGLSHCEQIGRFTLLDRGLEIERGELTPSLKMCRAVIAKNFAERIAAMYAG